MQKVLLYDIETAPIEGFTWGTYQTDVLWVKHDWYILMFAYKWLDGDTKVHSITDYTNYKRNRRNDKNIVQLIRDLFDKADIVVAHNGDKFDQKRSNTRFIKHGVKQPSPYLSIDTLKLARQKFGFSSNRLDSLGEFLGVGRKIETEKGLWQKCVEGDLLAFERMKEYNIQDVDLLEEVYKKLRPWADNLPHLNPTEFSCPKCGSQRMQKRGTKRTKGGTEYQSYWCRDCDGWSSSRQAIKGSTPELK